MSANQISKDEYDRGFLAAIEAVERIEKRSLSDIKESRKDLEEYSVNKYGSGVWNWD